MSAAQKEAWFTLAVIGLTAVVVVALIPWLGGRAIGGVGLLGLIGFTPLFYRSKPGVVAADERDAQIRRRSASIGFATIWCLFVSACIAAPFVYGETGCIPVSVLQVSLWIAFSLLYVVIAAATLLQYGRG